MEATTQRIVELVLRLLDRLSAHLGAIAGRHALTAMQAKVIWTLDVPCPMRAIADRLHCDASNVTGIIDRLEARGLVERQPDPADRRVKHVARTPTGDQLARDLRAEVFADVPAISRLGQAQQAEFIGLLELMVGDDVEPGDAGWTVLTGRATGG